MPQVPYSGVQQVGAQYRDTPRYSADTPPEAFGAGVANAISGLGKSIEGAGNELFARGVAMQDLNNHAEAQEASAKYIMKAGELHANYSALTGQAAVDAYPKYQADLATARKEIGASLSNDMSRKLFDSDSLSTMSRTVFNGAGHAAQQLKAFTNQSYDAKRVANINQTLQNPQDDSGFEEGQRRNERIIREQGSLNGAPSDATDNAIAQNSSAMWSARIAELAKTKPFEAQEMFEKNKGKLWYSDLQKTEDFLKSQMNTVGARQIAGKETADLYSDQKDKAPERGLEERVRSAIDAAKKLRPDDQEFQFQVEQTTRSMYTRRQQDILDTQRGNENTLLAGVIGDYGTKIPTTVDELKAVDPSVAKAWDDLSGSPKSRRAVIKALANNAKGDFPATEQTYREYMKLRGMAISDNPAERDQFMETSLVDLDIPMKWRSALNKQREAMIKSGGGDVNVSKYFRQLQDAGITPDRNDKDANLQFRGALQAALEEFQSKNNGRSPKNDEVKQIGSQLISSTTDPTKWTFGGLRSNQTPFYQQGLPSEERDKIIDAYRKDGINDPSDTMIQRMYLRKQYIKLYGMKPSATVPVGQSVPGAPQVPTSE